MADQDEQQRQLSSLLQSLSTSLAQQLHQPGFNAVECEQQQQQQPSVSKAATTTSIDVNALASSLDSLLPQLEPIMMMGLKQLGGPNKVLGGDDKQQEGGAKTAPVQPLKPAIPFWKQVDPVKLLQPAIEKVRVYGELLKLAKDNVLELETRLTMKLPNHQYCSPDITEFYFRQIHSFLHRHVHAFEPVAPGGGSTGHQGQCNLFDTGSSNTGNGGGGGGNVTNNMVGTVITDFFFEGDVRGRQVKTWDHKAGRARIEEMKWIQKKDLFRQDFYVHQRPLCVRLSLKSEAECKPVVNGVPEWIREKKRCTLERGLVSISCSIVSQGQDKQQVDASKPSYEIEIEARNNRITNEIPAEVIVGDLLLQTVELLGLETPWSISEMQPQ